MQITLDIPDDVYNGLVAQASQEKTTVGELLKRGAGLVGQHQTPSAADRKIQLPLIASTGDHVITDEMVYEHADLF